MADDYLHILEHHIDQLPPGWAKADDVTWHQVHVLLHRLFKWRNWRHS